MSGRGASGPYVFITSAIAFALAGLLWGLFQSGVIVEITGFGDWMAGTAQSQQLQSWVQTAWNWVLLVVLFRIAIQGLVASRLPGRPQTNVIVATATLLFFHVFLVLLAFVVPQMIDALIVIVRNNATIADALDDAGFRFAYRIATRTAYVYVPALLAIGADLFYLIQPIRSDVFGRRTPA